MDTTALATARKKLIEGDPNLANAYYEKAENAGISKDVIAMRQITREYLLFPLDFVGAEEYFGQLYRIKELAQDPDYADEYIQALQSLLKIKKLFIREIALYYFSEIAVCCVQSLLVEHIHGLYLYLNEHLDEIAEEDCYEIKRFLPKADMQALKIDLLKVKAFCLDLLLSYTAAQDAEYVGKSYHAYTYDCGLYYSTRVTSTDEYATWADLKPRLSLLGLNAYYEDYYAAYERAVEEVRSYTSFNCPKELRKEVLRQVTYKKSRDKTDKDYFKIAKQNARNDMNRSSLMSILMKLNLWYYLARPYVRWYYRVVFSVDDVGSFKPGMVFTRKKICGVCDMISCGSHWNIATVRFFMMLLGCIGIGAVAYVILAIAMLCGFYLPSVTVEKH